MTRGTDVVVVGGGAPAAGAERAAAAGGARVVSVAAIACLMRPGDALRGVVLRTDDVLEAVAVILADPATQPAAVAVGAEHGLRTDEHGRVLDAAQLPIPGLYAAADERPGNAPGRTPQRASRRVPPASARPSRPARARAA